MAHVEPTLPGPGANAPTAYGLESLILLLLALEEGGFWLEDIEDDPDKIQLALKHLYELGWELEITSQGRIRAARDAEAPALGFSTYISYVQHRVLGGRFWQSVVRGECVGRIGLYIDRAARDIEPTIDTFLKPGEDTLKPSNTDEEWKEWEENFDPNAAIATALS